MKLRRLVSAAAIIVCGALMAQPAAFAGLAAIGSCGKTISKSGSYVLSRNLTSKKMDQSCIFVSADFVTIDMQGFTIDCAAIGRDGIEACCGSLHSLVVRNGMITNCLNGIDASNEKDALIDHLIAIGNLRGVAVGAGSSVRDSLFSGNDTYGGIEATCPSNIINNTATANTAGDIVQDGAGCNLDNNATGP